MVQNGVKDGRLGDAIEVNGMKMGLVMMLPEKTECLLVAQGERGKTCQDKANHDNELWGGLNTYCSSCLWLPIWLHPLYPQLLSAIVIIVRSVGDGVEWGDEKEERLKKKSSSHLSHGASTRKL